MKNYQILNKTTIALVLFGLAIMFIGSFSYRLSNPSLVKVISERASGSSSFGNQGKMNTGMTPDMMAHISELMTKLRENPESFEVRIELAEHFMEVQDWTSAALHLQRALLIRPDDVATMYNLGVIHYQQDQFAESAKLFEQILNTEEDPSAMFNLGILYYQNLNRQDEGKALFAKVAGMQNADQDLRERAKAILESLK